MHKLTYATLSPGYGRDYTSGQAAQKDFEAGKDFMIHAPPEHMGRYCSIRDFVPNAKVRIRYAKLHHVVIFNAKPSQDKEQA
jgi:hypothetical protein